MLFAFAWFPNMYRTLVWQIFTRDNRVLRMRFLLSFATTWILVGTILATLLSTAGPIFQDLLTGTGNACDGYVGADLALLIWWAVGAALDGPVHRKRIAGAWNRPAKA